MVKFSICPFSCIIHLKFISYWLIFYIYYIYTKYIKTYTTFPNELLQLLVGQLTHEKILICLIFPHFSDIFAQITIFWNAYRPCQQYSSQFFSWCSGYICINYHIRKCTQTVWTIPQHCQQLSIACLFFSSEYFWFSHYIYITYHIRKCAQTM